jgi:hypothetical protein
MHPHGIAQSASSLEIPETVPIKEGVVDEHVPAVPIGVPAPTTPTPTAPAAKIETEIYAGIPPQTHIDPRVNKRRVNHIRLYRPLALSARCPRSLPLTVFD